MICDIVCYYYLLIDCNNNSALDILFTIVN
jgi:hypothetical protein